MQKKVKNRLMKTLCMYAFNLRFERNYDDTENVAVMIVAGT